MNELSSKDHQSEKHTRRQQDVEAVLSLLDRSARGENLAASLFEAMAAIAQCSHEREKNGPINLEQRGRLLPALVRAHTSATQQLLRSFDRAVINEGMVAVSYQIHMWAEGLDVTSRRNANHVLDVHDRAEILRNELRNLMLREQIADRAQKAGS
jgi:hypothetical protein